MCTKEYWQELMNLCSKINDMQNESAPFGEALELVEQHIKTNAHNYDELKLDLYVAIKMLEAWLDI